jgi:lipopolysaccharide transport system ATP-binding protein
MAVIEFQYVSKRYQIGQGSYGTLRDKLSALAKGLTGRLAGKKVNEAGQHELWALKGVSFAVDQGDALGIIGPNGAGKSTVLKLLARVTMPTSGKALTNGRVSALIELGAGFHPELTGRENIYLNGAIMGMKRAEVARKFDSIVAFAELEPFIDTPLKRYSSGMHARLGFSVAAHMEPDILLMDEVLSVGDIAFQVKCHRRMDEFRRNGTTIVFVSHNLEAVRNLCPRTILLDQGQVQVNDTTEKAIERYYQVMSSRIVAADAPGSAGNNEAKKAAIVGLQLLDGSGQPAFAFRSGDRAALVVELMLNEDMDSPFVGFVIRRSDRLVVSDTNSAFLGAGQQQFAEGTRLRVRFDFVMNLLRGTYQITSHVKDKERRRFYDYVDSAITFTVTESYSVGGVADLRPRCAVVQVE